jgi:hypothetical protein
MPRQIVLVVMVVLALVGAPAADRSPVMAQETTPTGAAVLDAGLARTNVRYFLPYNNHGLHPALTVRSRTTTSCESRSIASPTRPDAWRCGPGLDPCFAAPRPLHDPPELTCLSSPFARDVVLVTPTEPLPPVSPAGQDDDGRVRRPWALELVGGVQCSLLFGAGFGYIDLRANYGCTDGGIVLGEVDASQPFWVVTYLAQDGLATELKVVATAWI